MEKAPDAFRTISEVADVLDTPAHVLRFWESRFPQIRPIKRAGGRRYYRSGDVALLAGIRHLLHDQGLTIRGVQKILRENGVRHVQSLSNGRLGEGYGDITEASEIEAALNAEFLKDMEPERLPPAPEAEIVPLPARGPRPAKPVEQMLAEAPPAANVPLFDEPAAEAAPEEVPEEVPEAPFIEAEVPEAEETASVVPMRLTRPVRPAAEPEPLGLFDDLPLLAKIAGDPSAEDLDDLTAMEAVDRLAAEVAAQDGTWAAAVESAEPPAPPAPPAPAQPRPLAPRLRALPRPASPDTAQALSALLVRARALQARLAAADPSRD